MREENLARKMALRWCMQGDLSDWPQLRSTQGWIGRFDEDGAAILGPWAAKKHALSRVQVRQHGVRAPCHVQSVVCGWKYLFDCARCPRDY